MKSLQLALSSAKEGTASFGSFIREGFASLFRQGSYPACDGLRALAMIWVTSFHAVEHYASKTGWGQLPDTWWAISVPMNGDVGVDIFLVLSGFLLGGALCEEYKRKGSIDLPKFYAKRWFRIAPPYAMAMLASWLSDMPRGTQDGCSKFWWTNMLFINNYWPTWCCFKYNLCMVHTWTIAVEFQLYFATPPLFALAWFLSKRLPKMSFSAIAFMLGALVWLACCARRIAYVLEHGKDMVDGKNMGEPYVGTLYRMAPYAAGLCGGIAVQEVTKGHWTMPRWLAYAMACLSVVILLLCCLIGGEPGYFGRSSSGASYIELRQVSLTQVAVGRPFIGLAQAYLLVLVSTDNAPRLHSFLGARVWTPVAALSYSMYLLQYVGWLFVFIPAYNNYIKEWLVGSSYLQRLVVAYQMPLLAMLGTFPLALLNFLFVERSSMIVSKRLLAAPPKVAPEVPVTDSKV
mmetsp:Transcript_106471/g.189300  ORF Transcript_106471/g.189300 Transcript_106471/m.189300 type:complete len:460 (-) Transcript_106471:94-1473(-)|eukprot:CAMPEP_0197663712 /NCGR_PEP_ID=MMETSP1338-20131121/58195_1 /TAXON_ID=43686 ORGANISM="Pelagodinium beii, Strain RCC1491" /NCGR_SAMPLE_ID=MMETSP1338 /ASSEMBLY_ACC=CAM_ASM_000754 /LENGTH=459 /DNA_ID=CAMNT_0043242199 /DNA_START=59 /DNA_END=1438 /DNA_ORIENTATION=+